MRRDGLAQRVGKCKGEHRKRTKNAEGVAVFCRPGIEFGFDFVSHLVQLGIGFLVHGFHASNARSTGQWMAMVSA
ncbi:hypothetical protein D3C79_962490 [compost metagenome]